MNACAVDVDGNVQARALLERVQRGIQTRDVLVIAGESAAENADHPDGVLVTGFGGTLRVGDHLVALDGDEALIDIPVAAELVPAHLGVRAHH